MIIKLRNLIIIIGLLTFMIMGSGCTTPERKYDDDLLSFTIPANWNVDETKFSDELASLRPAYANDPVIYIHQTDLKPDEILDGYITNYPREYPRFNVVTREEVKVNGLKGEKLVYKNTAHEDFLQIGPDFFTEVVVFRDNNKTYIISTSDELEHVYHYKVKPALAVLMDSIEIK